MENVTQNMEANVLFSNLCSPKTSSHLTRSGKTTANENESFLTEETSNFRQQTTLGNKLFLPLMWGHSKKRHSKQLGFEFCIL